MAWTNFTYKDPDGTEHTVDISEYYGGNSNQQNITTRVNGKLITYNASGKIGNDAKVAYLVNYYLHNGTFGDIPAYDRTKNAAREIIRNIVNNQLVPSGSKKLNDAQISDLLQNPDRPEYAKYFNNNADTIIDPDTGEELDPNSERAKQLRLDEAQGIAYNNYWNNLFDRNREGSLGKEAYDQLLLAEQNNAQGAIDLANAQTQQLAMAQAQTVKNITDQVRAERMARLRAGMSESQIASQDMQQMIANTNALNDQIAASNMGVLQGQQQLAGAQQTAYQNWLNSMNQTGTTASAMAATDAGNPYQLAKQYGTLTPQQQNYWKTVIGAEQNKK